MERRVERPSSKARIAKLKLKSRKKETLDLELVEKKDKKGKIYFEIEVHENGCPICKGEVKGNDKYDFYCSGCNLMYKRHHLRIQVER